MIQVDFESKGKLERAYLINDCDQTRWLSGVSGQF
jgi:hypothetical protein